MPVRNAVALRIIRTGWGDVIECYEVEEIARSLDG